MNYKYLILTLFVLASFTGVAQDLIPRDGTIQHDKKSRSCLVVNLDPEPKTLKDAWNDYLKDNYDFKLDGIGFLANKDLMSQEEVVIPRISSKAMNFYTNVVEDDKGSEMKVFASFGYDIYVTKKAYPTEYAVIKNMLEGFIKEYIPMYYAEIIKDTEGEVKDLLKDDKKLEKDIKKAREDIDDLNQKIKEKQDALTKNENQLKQTKSDLTMRQQKLKRARSQLSKL